MRFPENKPAAINLLGLFPSLATPSVSFQKPINQDHSLIQCHNAILLLELLNQIINYHSYSYL